MTAELTKPTETQRTWKLARRYSRIIRAISQKDTRVVVSLGGGGVRMFAHAEILRILDELRVGDFIDEIWGASGGAIMGMLYSLGVRPEEIKKEGMKVYEREHFLPKLPSYFTLAGRVIKDAFLPLKRKSLMRNFHNYQDSLLEIVASVLKKEEPRYDFYCTAYNLETNRNDILSIPPVRRAYQREDIYQVKPLEAVAASSAIPIIFKPKEIVDKEGVKRTYVDGAMIEDVPTESVYKKWVRDREMGFEKRRRLLVLAVSLQTSFTSMSLLENWMVKRLPAYEYVLLSINCADFMRNARTKAQRQTLSEDPNVELWELHLDLPGGGVLSLDRIPEILQAAEQNFPKQLARINRSLLG